MEEKPENNLKIAEITKRYMGEKTLDEFAQDLGINVVRQNVHQWVHGIHMPATLTLFWVISSPTATPQAKAWAGECLSVIQVQPREAKLNIETRPVEIEKPC
jgi:hypothetical protein